MGKECYDSRRFRFRRGTQAILGFRPGKPEDCCSTWNKSEELVLGSQVKEDGNVMVTIRTSCMDTTFLCTGMAREGNRYMSLLDLLREESYIHWNERIVRIFHRRGADFHKVDIEKGWFSAGDRIIVVVEKNHRIKRKSRDRLEINKSIRKHV